MRKEKLDRLRQLHKQESYTNDELRELAALLREYYPYARARILGLELEQSNDSSAQQKAYNDGFNDGWRDGRKGLI